MITCVFLLSSCTDINDVPTKAPGSSENENEPVTPTNTPVQAPRTTYPIDRIIADPNGRSIDVKIAAKQGDEIGVIKKGTYAPFVLTISQLSEKDQAFLSSLTDGGDLGAIKALVERFQKLTGRVANWNPQFYNAEKEAAQLGLPLLTVFLITDDPESAQVEKNVVFNRDFRNWANWNLALCLLKLDSTESQKISSISAGDNRKIASNFGVENEFAFILSIPGHSPVNVNARDISSAQSAIDAINQVINKPELGSGTSAIPVPERSNPGQGQGKGKGGK